MMNLPDFEPLFEMKPNLYKETCPVLLQSGALFCVVPESEDAEPRTFARLVFRNIDDRAITAMYIDVHVFDKANNEIEAIRDRRYLVPVMGRDETFGSDDEIDVSAAANSFSVAIKRVEFEGEDVWDGSASFLFEGLPERKTLENSFEEISLAEQFGRDYSESMAKNGGFKAVYAPEEYKDLWLCTCGEVNHREEECCVKCGAGFEVQKELIEDADKLSENLEAYIKAEEEKAEQARLEAERKAEEERKAAEEAARRAEEERLAAEERARIKKRNRKIFLAVSIPTAIALVIFIIVLIQYLIPLGQYRDAEAMLADAKYDEAIAAFAELEDFKDSQERIPQAQYDKGCYLIENEKYDEAIAVLESIPEVEGSEEKIKEAKFKKAVNTMDSEAYAEALEQLEALGDYDGCAEKIELCHYNLGLRAVSEDDIESAAADYEMVNDGHKLDLQNAFCDKGVEFYSAGDEARALEYFALVTDESVLSRINAVYYEQGVQLVLAQDYDTALEVFMKLGEYEDSVEWVQEVHYLKGLAATNAGDLATALSEYELTGMDYKDTKTKFRDVSYAYGVQLLNKGQVVDSYEVLYPIRTYFPAYELLVTNSQYYRYVYDVNIGPNPDHEKVIFE